MGLPAALHDAYMYKFILSIGSFVGVMISGMNKHVETCSVMQFVNTGWDSMTFNGVEVI